MAKKEVTPFVGVWIETDDALHLCQLLGVTPFVGVWIETNITASAKLSPVSHPSWVCGLKQEVSRKERSCQRSHPSWVCGLKQQKRADKFAAVGHTLRGCVD